MITEVPVIPVSRSERSQIARLNLALGSWRQGQTGNALLILAEIKREVATPRVAARILVAEAGFKAELGDFDGSEAALNEAASVIDSADAETRGSFYVQRGRVHRRRHEIDEALTDYTGAAICWELAGNVEKQGAAYLNIADLQLGIPDLDAAQLNLGKALQLLSEAKSFYLPQARDTQAKLFLAQGKPGAALDAIMSALSSVGDNETWRQEFTQTKRQILLRLLDALEITTLADCDRLKVFVTEKALRESSGSLSAAGRIIGATHHAVAYIVDQNKELEPYRVKRRVYRRSIIKH